MRVMTPAEKAASVSAGRMRCSMALKKATKLPVMRASTAVMPVICVTGWLCATAMSSSPETGSRPSARKKRSCRTMARKNDGSETPPMAKTRVTWSIQRPFMCAVSAPSETPTTIEMSSEKTISWSE